MSRVKIYPAPPVNKAEILRYAGTDKNDADILDTVDDCLTVAADCLSFRVCYDRYPIARDGGILDLGFVKTDSNDLRKNLTDCKEVVLFAASVGVGIDRLIEKYSHISPLKALIFSAIGSERVESLCDAFCRDIMQESAQKGEYIRPRFSAGYGDLPLTVQRDIFAALECNKAIGVTLNGDLLMSPSKSVTAVIGVSDRERKL